MSFRKSISYAALTVALTSGTAFADVSAADVWGDWKAYMQSFGYETTGTESISGDTLTVSDISMAVELPDDEGSFDLSMGTLTFTDTGNGTVTVGLPENMPISFDVDPETGEPAKGMVNIQQTSPVMIVSGDPGDFTYTYSATSVTMTLQELVAGGITMPPEAFAVNITMNDISNTTRTTVGDLRGYDGDMSVASLTYDISVNGPDGPDAGSGKFVGAMNGLTIASDAAFPPDVNSADMAAMLAAGTKVFSSFTYESGNSDFAADGPDGPVSGATSSDGGTITVKMDPEGLLYDVSQSNLKVNMQTRDLPFPVALELAKAAFVFGMPVAVSDDPQDFTFGFTMGDFTISDGIWGMIDPAGQLPRDPATLALNLTGKIRVLADLFAPESMMTGEMPGELNTLDINTLLVSLAGAKLSGTGAFSFDNTDFDTFNGVPRPEGALDVRLEGANGLLDTLVNMGLLPQEQAMGARMMMGLFGVPQGDDTLTSKIEVNDQGHVLANGQRLQ